MAPCPQSKTGHCWTDLAHDAKCAKCCHCGEVRDLPPKVVEVLVNVHATRKVPGAVQYSSDEKGGSISLRASIREGENIMGATRMLWDLAEVELEKRGLTVVRKEAEVGRVRPKARCRFETPDRRCAEIAVPDEDFCEAHLVQPAPAKPTEPKKGDEPATASSSATPAGEPSGAFKPADQQPARAADEMPLPEWIKNRVASWEGVPEVKRREDGAYRGLMTVIEQQGGRKMGYWAYLLDRPDALEAMKKWAARWGWKGAGA